MPKYSKEYIRANNGKKLIRLIEESNIEINKKYPENVIPISFRNKIVIF